MINCTLQIQTIGEETSDFKAEGVFEQTENGGKVVYPVESDEGTIAFDQLGMTMSRRGECGLSARFRAGERTQMILSSNDTQGAIPLETTGYDLEKKADGFRLSLHYTLNGSNWIQKFRLKIRVKFSEEK